MNAKHDFNDHSRTGPPAGQPPTDSSPLLHPSSRLPLPALLPLVGMMLLVTALGAEPLAVGRLSGSARHLDWHPEDRVITASMALHGVAFAEIAEDGTISNVAKRDDWRSLASLSLSTGRHLLADRFEGLRLVQLGDGPAPAPPRELALWPAEGIPTDLLFHEGRLFVASGAAGVNVYTWDGSEQPPRLSARYPFADYSKGLDWHAEGQRLLVADNFDRGMQMIDTAELLRPRHLMSYSLGFVDAVAAWDGLVAVGSRHLGVAILSVKEPPTHVYAAEIPLRPGPGGRHSWLRSVRFDGEGRLLVCEGSAGARLFQAAHGENGTATLEPLAELETLGGGALDAIFLSDGQIALSTETGMLIILANPPPGMAP